MQVSETTQSACDVEGNRRLRRIPAKPGDRCGLAICLVVAPLIAGCSLVTVPVKAVASVAETAIETTGTIVTAPFKAVSGGDSSESDAAKPDEKRPADDSGAPTK